MPNNSRREVSSFTLHLPVFFVASFRSAGFYYCSEIIIFALKK